MDTLPLSSEALAEEESDRPAVHPDDRPFPVTHLGRGRGLLALFSLLGMASFVVLPWVQVSSPYDATFTGLDLARRGAGWLWGGAVGWFILFPLVASRRTVSQMQGVRIIAALLAWLTLFEVLTLVIIPPRGNPRVPYDWTWNYGLFVSAVLSGVAGVVAVRFGGRSIALAPAPSPLLPVSAAVPPRNRTLH